MTTEHVSVPREFEALVHKLRTEAVDIRYGGSACGWAKAEELEYSADEIEAILSRATPREWSYCPECGCEELHHQEGEHKQCANCYQDYFDTIDYSEVVRGNLSKLFKKAQDNKPSAPSVVTDEDVQRAKDTYEEARSKGTFHEAMRAALESFATSLPAAIPPGYVVVPVKPTEEMKHAAKGALRSGKTYLEMWEAMLAAAPQAGDKP